MSLFVLGYPFHAISDWVLFGHACRQHWYLRYSVHTGVQNVFNPRCRHFLNLAANTDICRVIDMLQNAVHGTCLCGCFKENHPFGASQI